MYGQMWCSQKKSNLQHGKKAEWLNCGAKHKNPGSSFSGLKSLVVGKQSSSKDHSCTTICICERKIDSLVAVDFNLLSSIWSSWLGSRNESLEFTFAFLNFKSLMTLASKGFSEHLIHSLNPDSNEVGVLSKTNKNRIQWFANIFQVIFNWVQDI